MRTGDGAKGITSAAQPQPFQGHLWFRRTCDVARATSWYEACSSRNRVGLRASPEIMLRESARPCRGSGLDYRYSRVAVATGGRRAALGLDSRGRLSPRKLRTAGWAFDPMTGKGGGNERN